ncbi:alcohol dehydrogenase catalytic domain-containing protein [Photobacterium halotolerans]|uniref:Zinc-binding dehydrogenase n=1 Tax=Photobacterium halotolerans TaxID=265726 RepID=A0A7X4Y0M5_9GAMM|nr:zinc-binding dehydrogenase [Photobacterium halotolerans]NAW67215.1 zinc-binding dehydrogenase [Photobacterium halotolerans]NAW85052.1 zinc-binding dehydrogenase [Photobacterium halotolerans]NAX48757.1 zinc-binding dehydrogenase [Photobacterium halotolerans]
MKAWTLTEPNGLDSLQLTRTTRPKPGAEEICIKVAAMGLNPIDYKLADWGYATWHYPQIVGMDIAGTVESVGVKVRQFKPGDRVFTFLDPRHCGGFAEYVCCKTDAVSRLPEKVSVEQAAALPSAGYSAWLAVYDKLRLKPGQRVAITGAGGGVGGFAAQLAKLAGATVYAIAAKRHHARLLSYGVDAVIDSDHDNVAMKIIELTEDKLLHAVIDCVSARSGSIMSALIRFNGQIVMVADQFNQVPLLATTKALSMHEVALHGTYAHGAPEDIHHLSDMGNSMSNLIAEGKLDAMIDKLFAFEQLKEGLALLHRQQHSGKLVVVLD